MKKISLLFLMVSTSFAVFAQTGADFGIKGGLNIANQDIKVPGDANSTVQRQSRLGLNAGLLAHIHVTPEIAIQPEALYSSQGSKYTINNQEHELQLDYINVPVQFQLMFKNGFRVQTGPQVGFLVNTKDKVGGVETGYFTSADFKKTDVAWTFGAGYLTNSGIGIDARYNLGLTNINNVGTNTIKNNVAQLGLFYMFNNNHKAVSSRY
jgi:hypothetical protein